MTQPGVSGGEGVPTPVTVAGEAPAPEIDKHYYDTFYVSQKVTVYRSPDSEGRRARESDWLVSRIFTDTDKIVVSNRAKQEKVIDVRLLYKWNTGIDKGISTFEYRGSDYLVVDFKDGVFQLTSAEPFTEGRSIMSIQNIRKTPEELMKDDDFILKLPKKSSNGHV